ncbi:MAG: hypothetical protein STSR0008_25440 [Ignavibacterium sp.]
MKTLFLIILLLNPINLFAQDENDSYSERSILLRSLRINFQGNILQSMVLSDSIGKHDYLLDNSFSVGFELVSEYKGLLNYGIGAMYQFPSSIVMSKGEIGIFPVYAFIDYPLSQTELFPIQLSIRFGYAFLSTKDGIDKIRDGIYHSLGFTMVISKKFQLKLMYAHNYGKIKIDLNEYSLKRENMSLSINFKL